MVSFAPKYLETQYWPQTIVEIVSDAHAIGWSSEEMQQLWKVHVLMARLFSGRYRGSGRPFINHLAGTAALALRHGGGVTEVLAGYGHAAYEQGEFGRARQGASKANQRELRTAVGDAAEAIIADYAGFDWNGIACAGTPARPWPYRSTRNSSCFSISSMSWTTPSTAVFMTPSGAKGASAVWQPVPNSQMLWRTRVSRIS